MDEIIHAKKERLLELISELVGKPVTMAAVVIAFKDNEREIAVDTTALVCQGASAFDIGKLCGHAMKAARDVTADGEKQMRANDQGSEFDRGYSSGVRSVPFKTSSVEYCKKRANKINQEDLERGR